MYKILTRCETREEVNKFLSKTGSSLFSGEEEPWHTKDALQILTEIVLLRDLSTMQREALAVLIQVVCDFGRDAMATIAFLLVMRVVWRHGRVESAEETQWICQTALKAIARANEYQVSEHAGELELGQLLEGL